MYYILYKQDSGRVAILAPSPEYLEVYGIHGIAKKDVPEGKPYRIVHRSELPSDYSQRDSWTVDDGDLIDGVGSPDSVFITEPA